MKDQGSGQRATLEGELSEGPGRRGTMLQWDRRRCDSAAEPFLVMARSKGGLGSGELKVGVEGSLWS